MKLNYVPSDAEVIESFLSWQKQGLQETASGYGSRLTTTKKVKYNNRWYRVYATCYSNVASCWIKVKGNKLFLFG